jgi:hypothetical protein
MSNGQRKFENGKVVGMAFPQEELEQVAKVLGVDPRTLGKKFEELNEGFADGPFVGRRVEPIDVGAVIEGSGVFFPRLYKELEQLKRVIKEQENTPDVSIATNLLKAISSGFEEAREHKNESWVYRLIHILILISMNWDEVQALDEQAHSVIGHNDGSLLLSIFNEDIQDMDRLTKINNKNKK